MKDIFSDNKKRLFLLVIILAVFAAAIIIIISVAAHNNKISAASQGVQYIQTEESRDAVAVENSIFEASKQRKLSEMRDELEEDPDQVWSMLNELNAVYMGDSRVVGFNYYGYVDESHVLAYVGANISYAEDDFQAVQALNPQVILLGYGINDMNGYWTEEPTQDYLDEIDHIMQSLTDMLPNAYIYLQSIMPVQDFALEDNDLWGYIPQWNVVIKEHCEEMGWRYLDVSELLAEHEDLYEGDGIHFTREFYPYWAETILMRYLDDSLD